MAGIKDIIERDKDVVCRQIKDTPFETIVTVEGNKIPDAVEKLQMKALIVTENVIVLRALRKKGLRAPKHQHNDHDTVSTGDESFPCEPGAVWRHRKGVPHWTETLEDSVVLEIKTPPVKTW